METKSKLIYVDGLPHIEASVVMLATDKESNIIKHKETILQYYENLIKSTLRGNINQHLYFITDDEIKDQDWFINDDGVWQCTGGIIPTGLNPKKIVATTDKLLQRKEIVSKNEIAGSNFNNLYLPQPSQAFIEAYVKQGGIDRVLIEVEYQGSFETMEGGYRIKVDPTHNTITIRLVDKYNLEQRIGWLSQRIKLTESDKDYILFQMKEIVNLK